MQGFEVVDGAASTANFPFILPGCVIERHVQQVT